jgi:hypothetical protein
MHNKIYESNKVKTTYMIWNGGVYYKFAKIELEILLVHERKKDKLY